MTLLRVRCSRADLTDVPASRILRPMASRTGQSSLPNGGNPRANGFGDAIRSGQGWRPDGLAAPMDVLGPRTGDSRSGGPPRAQVSLSGVEQTGVHTAPVTPVWFLDHRAALPGDVTVTPLPGPPAVRVLRDCPRRGKGGSSLGEDHMHERADCPCFGAGHRSLASIRPRTQRDATARNGTSGKQLKEPFPVASGVWVRIRPSAPVPARLTVRPVFSRDTGP